MTEDNHVCAGDLLIIYVKRATSWSDFPALERGEQAQLRSLEEKKKNMHEQCFQLNCWFVSLLAGSRLTGTCYKAIFSFYSTLCKSNPLFGLKRLHSVPLNFITSGCKLTPAGLRRGCATEYGAFSHFCLVYCPRRRGNFVLPLQIIANHMSLVHKV